MGHLDEAGRPHFGYQNLGIKRHCLDITCRASMPLYNAGLAVLCSDWVWKNTPDHSGWGRGKLKRELPLNASVSRDSAYKHQCGSGDLREIGLERRPVINLDQYEILGA